MVPYIACLHIHSDVLLRHTECHGGGLGSYWSSLAHGLQDLSTASRRDHHVQGSCSENTKRKLSTCRRDQGATGKGYFYLLVQRVFLCYKTSVALSICKDSPPPPLEICNFNTATYGVPPGILVLLPLENFSKYFITDWMHWNLRVTCATVQR